MSSQGGYKAILAAMASGIVSKNVFRSSKIGLVEKIDQAVKNNQSGYTLKGKSEGEILSTIARISLAKRKKVIYQMQREYGFSYPNAKYMPVLTEIEGYDLKEIDVAGETLQKGKLTEFEVNFPYNSSYTFVGSQFIKLVTSKPQIVDSTIVPRGYEVRYWYCPKPGVRLINEIEELSDTSAFDGYKQIDVLKYENDSLTDNLYEIWNRMIGNDLGIEANLYNASLQQISVHTIKDGYQTGKAEQEPLTVYIPLLFSHNRNLNDKVNLSAFNKNTISIRGKFERSEYIVRAAAFNLADPSESPIPLEVQPLKVTECGLYSLFTALDDVMFALNTGIYYKYLYSHTKSETYVIKNSTLTQKLREKSESLQMAVMVRPKWYSADFDLWTEFTPIEKMCYPVPSVVFDPSNGSYKIAVQGAEYNKPVPALEYINLFYDGICMMADGTNDGNGDPRVWSQIDVYSKSLRYLNYRVRKEGMIYFNFNPHVNTKKISCIYNFGKLSDSVLQIKFAPTAGITPNGDLSQPYEMITFSDALNEHVFAGDSATKTIITS